MFLTASASPKTLSILALAAALLTPLGALQLPHPVSGFLRAYTALFNAAVVAIALRSGGSARDLLKPDAACLAVSSGLAIGFGGYVPPLVTVFTLVTAISAMFAEEKLGDPLLGPGLRALWPVGGRPGQGIRLYPSTLVEDDSMISRGSVVVREPIVADHRSYRGAGDLVLGLSAVEAGSAEATILAKGSLAQAHIEGSARLVSKIALAAALAYYAILPLALLWPLGAYLVVLMAPSLPYTAALAAVRRSRDVARQGIVSPSPVAISSRLCRSWELYIDFGAVLSNPGHGEALVRPRGSVGREVLVRILCAARGAEDLKILCRGAEDVGEGYRIVYEGRDITVLEDRRSRIRICVSTPELAKAHGFEAGGGDRGLEACEGKLYIVSTRHEILGSVCVPKRISPSDLSAIARVSEERRIVLLVREELAQVLEGLLREMPRSLQIARIRGPVKSICSSRRGVKILSEIPGEDCPGSIVLVDPRTASRRYGDLRDHMERGGSISMRRDLAWLENVLKGCGKWRGDAVLAGSLYTLFKAAGALISYTSSTLWAPLLLETAVMAIMIFRLYSR